MRITGGDARGIPLKAGRNAVARPATDQLREALFSSLGSLTSNAHFLDLFAGTGAYGLEAWSRGAAGGIFVERNRAMAQAVEENINSVARSLKRERDPVQVVLADVTRWSPRQAHRANLIFIDPPYESIATVATDLFKRLPEWLASDGVVVFEMPGGTEVAAPGWECFKRLGKGRRQPSCCFYRLAI